MARKKKTTAKLKEKLDMQTNQLTYQGKVSFKILHGTKVISTKNYSNKGLPELFRYISHALAGSQYTALRPCKVALFNYPTADDYENPATFDWNNAHQRGELKAVSPYVIYDATPIVTATALGYATTFRFKIPFNWLYTKKFNVLGLFTENNIACAYYLFTKDKADNTKEWDVQELSDIVGNYSIVIE